MNLMLLAAGEGTRLRPYTLTLPKPAIPFLNVPIAAHSLRFLGNIQINKLVVNTFHLAPEIEKLFKRLPHRARELHFSHEVGEILGSGGGLGNARAHFKGGGDFIWMNGDELILPKDLDIIEKVVAYHKKTEALATIVVIKHPEVGTKFGGVWANSENQVKTFGRERPATGETGWHFIGVQILSEKVFQYIPEKGPSNILYDALVAGIQAGEKVQVYPIECRWFETGNPEDYMKATSECAKILFEEANVEKTSLETSFAKYMSARPQLQKFKGASLIYSSDAIIDPSSEFKGFICAGEGSEISADCKLENVIVGAGVKVPPGTQASNTLLL
ncbi:nucleotidyltransferase family protein [Bdellovibrio sp. HCB2-146]|uniref:nucleotidyltransferase family protein n=1 Tax=Bdellovibrio sp. HCB2-146 TaxID=3394362 RepID=UPI0039BD62F9